MRNMNRRDFVKRVGMGAGAAAIPASVLGAKSDSRPNIIYVMADDLGYGHLGCYGQEKIKTPNIDRLASEGLRFTDFYAGYTVCAPSRSVLMTGLHHGHTPIRSNSGSSSLLENETTVAQVLQKAGYATGGFGKWGVGIEGLPGHPNKKGFDEFWGYYHQVHAHFFYPYWIWHNEERHPLPGNENKREQYVPDVLHDRCLAFIRSSAAKKKPFFCYVPSIIPHVELTVPEDSLEPYRGKFPKVTINDPRTGYIGSDDAYTVYAGMIGRLDRQVGEIAALLKELGIEENTLLIFTSDNGPQSGPWVKLFEFFNGAGPLSGAKGSLNEGGIRVPFIARWKGKIEPGTVSGHVGCFQDMMPTFADLAGAEPPENDGVSIAPTLLGQSKRQEKHAYLYWGGKTEAVRMGKWKGLKTGKEDWRLYDLTSDVGEKTDVAADHPDAVERIARFAKEAYTEPRKQIGGTRVGIKDYVRAPRITQKNAR